MAALVDKYPHSPKTSVMTTHSLDLQPMGVRKTRDLLMKASNNMQELLYLLFVEHMPQNTASYVRLCRYIMLFL
jgi:hypothetical protein